MKATVFTLVSVLLMGWSGLNGQSFQRQRGRAEKRPVVDRFNFFDIELLQEVCSNPAENGNVMVSPVSVKAVLAMLLEGASGSSAKQIIEALRLNDKSKDDIRNHIRTFLQSLQSNNRASYSVEIASLLFVSKYLHVWPEYANALKEYYRADARGVDFNEPIATAKSINDWVNMGTHGLIPTLVDPQGLPANSLMMFANALYFKGKWKESFDVEATSVRCFHTSVNQCRDAYMMESLTYYPYANIPSLDAQAVELPYDGDKFSMLVLLPNKVDGVKQLVRDLPHGFHGSVINKLEMTEILVMMPRFSIEYSTDLIAPLRNLHIEDVFGSKANLSGIVQETPSGAYISKVIHKTKIVVNEEGTIAAGSTGALVVPLIGSSIPKFAADRPFVFLIRDLSSGGYLFAGRVNIPDPTTQAGIDLISNPYLDTLTSKAPPSYSTSHPEPNIDVRNLPSRSSVTRHHIMLDQTMVKTYQQRQPDGQQTPQSNSNKQFPQYMAVLQPNSNVGISNQQRMSSMDVLFPDNKRQ